MLDDFDPTGSGLEPDRPIAFTRVALLAEGEAWFEGIRVDPRVRGRSIATYLQVAELRWAKAHDARVVRYATAADNEASHRLGARHGFRFAGAWRSYGGEEDVDGDRIDREGLLEQLAEAGLSVRDESELSRWWSLFEEDETLRAGSGLYECRPWSLQALTQERLSAHMRRGEVLVRRDGGDASALAILPLSAVPADETELHIGLLAGAGEDALRLLVQIERVAGRRVRFRLPEPDPPLLRTLGRAFADAGFPAHAHVMHILERRLDDLPLPEPDDPSLLIYADEPRPLAVPPQIP